MQWSVSHAHNLKIIVLGIKVFNHLPENIKNLEHSPVKFKNALKSFFHQHPFYSIKEYFEQGNPIRGSFE
jgi:hypothetical protein